MIMIMLCNVYVAAVIRYWLLWSASESQWTQNICITFVQCWTSVEDAGPTLYKCYTNILCLLHCKWANISYYSTSLEHFLVIYIVHFALISVYRIHGKMPFKRHNGIEMLSYAVHLAKTWIFRWMSSIFGRQSAQWIIVEGAPNTCCIQLL